jgi:hypothetical protein
LIHFKVAVVAIFLGSILRALVFDAFISEKNIGKLLPEANAKIVTDFQ